MDLLFEDAKGVEEFDLQVRAECPNEQPIDATYRVRVALDYAIEFRYPEHLADPGVTAHVRSESRYHPMSRV